MEINIHNKGEQLFVKEKQLQHSVVVHLALLFIFCLFFIPLTSAEVQTLGTFPTEYPINLIQICQNCTYNNITSVIFPNGSVLLSNVAMTKLGTYYNYTIAQGRASASGRYVVNGFGDLNGQNTVWSYDFFINAVGQELDSSKAILYSVIFVIAIILFFIFIVLGVSLPYKNESDQMTGYIVAVSSIKYVKILAWFFAYLSLLTIIYFGQQISHAYLDLPLLSNSLNVVFYFMVIGIFVGFPLTVYFMIANGIRDSKVIEALERGMRIKE